MPQSRMSLAALESLRRIVLEPSAYLQITGVEPAEPIEGKPITVNFIITSYNHDPQVRITSDSNFIELKLMRNQPTKGHIQNIAPTAGVGRPIVLLFWYLPIQGELLPPNGQSDPYPMDIAAEYEFRIESVFAETTRDNFGRGHGLHPKDFLVGSTTALYGGIPIQDPDPNGPFDLIQDTQVEVYDWIESGTRIQPNMRFGPFMGIPGKAPQFAFSYVFARAAKAKNLEDHKRVMDAISGAGRDIAKILYPAGNAWDGIHELHTLIHSEIFADCDGVVAVDKMVAESAALAALTDNREDGQTSIKETPHDPQLKRIAFYRSKGIYSETRVYKGYNSPGACGSDLSEYHITFIFDRLSYPYR